MSIGMSADEYWNGHPYLAVAYREAHKLRSERDNGNAWWQGLYVRDAVLSVAAGMVSKKTIPYPTKPYRITPLTEKEKEEERQKERDKAIRSLTAWKDAWDKQHGE